MQNPPKRPNPTQIMLRWFMLAALLLAGCQADQSSKHWAQAEFKDKPARTLIPKLLEFRYAENPAIAFSMFHNLPDRVRKPLIYSLSGVGFAALLTVIWLMRKQNLIRLFPLALILSGAIGNLMDRLSRGYVVDFVHVHWRDVWSFPIFNIADSLITIGLGFWMALSLFLPQAEDKADSEGKAN
jgi:signal peptidase II